MSGRKYTFMQGRGLGLGNLTLTRMQPISSEKPRIQNLFPFFSMHILLHTRGLKSYIYPQDCSVSLAKNVKFNNKPDISLLRCTEDIISCNVVFKTNKL